MKYTAPHIPSEMENEVDIFDTKEEAIEVLKKIEKYLFDNYSDYMKVTSDWSEDKFYLTITRNPMGEGHNIKNHYMIHQVMNV